MSMSLEEVARRVVQNRTGRDLVFNRLPDDLYLYVRFVRFDSDGSFDLECSGEPIGVEEAARLLDADDRNFGGVVSLCVPLSQVYSDEVDGDMRTGDPAVWDRLDKPGRMRPIARYVISELERWAFTRLGRSAEMPSKNSVEARLQYAEATAAFLAATSHDANPISIRQSKSTTPPQGVPVWSIPEPALSAQLALPEAAPAGTGLSAELDTIRLKPEDKKRYRGKGVLVAVLDTGTSPNHPAFAGLKMKAVDATGTNPSGRDSNGHGTGCCGIVAGRVGSGYPSEYEGVAPEVGLLSVQVLTAGGWGTDEMIARGVQIARAAEADVISMSLGGPGTMPKTARQLADALDDGIVIVAAAGNDGPGMGTVGYPGRYEVVQCVGATGNGDDPGVAGFSSRGPEVDLMAPGVNVLMPHPNGGWWRGSGTSMATPFVAGAVALGIEADAGEGVEHATRPVRVISAMTANCRKLPAPGTGAGVIDVSAALAKLEPVVPPPPPPPPSADDPDVVGVTKEQATAARDYHLAAARGYDHILNGGRILFRPKE